MADNGVVTRLSKWWPLLALAVLLAGYAGSLSLARQQSRSATSGYESVVLPLEDKKVVLDIADTTEKQQLGLGGRSGLSAKRGMVFVYSGPGNRCFWMKDMKFPIDIIWVKPDKSVGHIERSVSPDTYPKTYCPDVAAQYVVELAAGESERNRA